MLLQSRHDPFNSDDYFFEWKVDGIRCIMFFDSGKVRLQSKNGKDCSKQFPELMSPQLEAQESVFDGEITIFTGGKPDFEGVMERYLAGEKKITSLVLAKPAVYIVWDILWVDDRSVMELPLLERKETLEQSLGDSSSIQKIDWVDGYGLIRWAAVKDHGLEGIVAKKKNSRYIPWQRSASWLKIKNYQEITVNVFGYSRKDGGVLVGTGNRVQGHAIGMGNTDRNVLRELLDQYGIEKAITFTFLPVFGGGLSLPLGHPGKTCGTVVG